MPSNKTEKPQLTSSAVMSFPQPALRNAEEYLKAYTGYSYTAISAIAQEVASIDLHLFQVKHTKAGPETTEIYEHESLSMLGYINPLTTFYDMVEATQIYLELTGEAFWIILKEGQTPKEAWLVRPDWMKVIPDSQTVIKGYSYHPGGGMTGVTIPKENVIHFKYFHPMNPYRGKGSIQAAALPLDIHTFAQEYNRNFFFNSAMPSMVFSTEQKLSDPTVKRFLEQWQASFGGRSKSNKIAFLGNGLKLDKITTGAKELDFAEQQKMMRDDILAVFKVPKTILGLTDDVNRANAEATTVAFMERVITPRMRKFTETLSEFLLPMFPNSENYFIDFTDPAPENVEMKLKYYENALKYGWMTPNEVRAEENMEPIEGGDELPKQQSLMPKEEPEEPELDDEGNPKKPEEDEDEEKGIVGVFKKLFTKKEVKAITVAPKRVFKKKAFKHMVKIPVKNLSTLSREHLEKELTPLVTDFIGELLKTKELTHTGIKDIKKESEVESKEAPLWTDENKDAYWKQFISMTTKREEELRNVVVDAFREQEHLVMDLLNNSVKHWRKEFRKGKESSALPSKVDMNKIWMTAFLTLIKEIYIEQGNYVLDFLGTGAAIDITSETAVEYLRQVGADLVKDIDDTTRENLRNTLAEGFKLGEGIDKLRDRVTHVFDVATTSRATMIARTESLRASNMATVEAYRQSGVVEAKEWLAERDGRTCAVCESLDGKVVGVSKDFFKVGDSITAGGETIAVDYMDVVAPPLHPDCRCTTIPIIIGSRSYTLSQKEAKKKAKVDKAQAIVNDMGAFIADTAKMVKDEADKVAKDADVIVKQKLSKADEIIKQKEEKVLTEAKQKAEDIVNQAKHDIDKSIDLIKDKELSAKKEAEEIEKAKKLILKKAQKESDDMIAEAKVTSEKILANAKKEGESEKASLLGELKEIRDKAREALYGQK